MLSLDFLAQCFPRFLPTGLSTLTRLINLSILRNLLKFSNSLINLFFLLQVAALLTLLFVVVINLAFGILPHVDNMGHLGGFVVGFLLGFVLLARPQFKWLAREHIPQDRRLTSKYKPYQYILRLISLALMIAG